MPLRKITEIGIRMTRWLATAGTGCGATDRVAIRQRGTRPAMASATDIRAAVVHSTDSSQGAEAAHRYWVRLMLREFRTQGR